MGIADSNLFYRRPELYDRVRDDQGALAKLIGQLADAYAPAAATVLDLGCGTGRDLDHLAGRFTDGVGVDLQPQMVGYAREVRPHLDLRVGDLRTVRLGRTFDLITCLGNTLAYIHDNLGLRAAFETFAAHAHPGTLLVLLLPVAPCRPARDGLPPRTVREATVGAEVTLTYAWDLRTQIETTFRAWRLDDGTLANDTLRRRVLFPMELEGYLTAAEFTVVEMFSDPGRRDGGLSGSDACVVARATTAR